MKIIKRNGSEVTFEVEKIVNAIAKANAEVPEDQRLTEREIQFASLNVTDECEKAGHTVTVEEVQDLVEDQLRLLTALRLLVSTSFTATSRTRSVTRTPPMTRFCL